MTQERDIERLLDQWFSDGPNRAPDRVVDIVADRIGGTRQRPAWRLERRLLDMNLSLKIGMTAAAVVLMAVIGYNLLPGSGVGLGGPAPSASLTATPTPSPKPTPTVTPVPMPSAGVLAAGIYVMTPFVGIDAANACYTPPQPGCIETPADDSIRITVTLPAGWEVDPLRLGVWLTGKNNTPPDGANLFVERGGWLYRDPCHPSATTAINVGPSVDDFANAIANNPKLDATTPVPVTLAGYSGKYMDLQIPADISGCTDGYWPWEPGFFAQGPSQRWHLWILDVNGIRVVILTADYAETSAADRAALQAMVDSIQIKP